MFDPWPDCGWKHLAADARGWLRPSDDWLRLWLQRPELALVPESCKAERALHAALLEQPTRVVSDAELAAFADADARENHGHFLRFRDTLLAAGSLQGWLLALFRQGVVDTPPLFIERVVEAVVRQLLDGSSDAFAWRAAELLFRPQRIGLHDGRVLAGDRDTLDLQQQTHGFGELGRLLAQAQAPLKGVSLQVLSTDNQARCLDECQLPQQPRRFLLDLTAQLSQDVGHGVHFTLAPAHSGLKALAGVLQAWIQHLLGVAVTIRPLARIDDPQWRWHVGLDAEASLLLDDLYEGRPVDEARQRRLLGLFKLSFDDPAEMRADVAGKPVYLGLMMTADKLLKLKPQNLLLNLPLARSS